MHISVTIESAAADTEKDLTGAQKDTSFFRSSRFLQSPFWASFKSAYGWQSYTFKATAHIDGDTQKTDAAGTHTTCQFECAVLVRRLAKCAAIAYIPMGPDIPDIISGWGHAAYFELLSKYAAALKPHLPKHTLYIRFDPPVDFETASERDVASASFNPFAARHSLKLHKSRTDIQPPDTVLLDIDTASVRPETLLENMKPKWRYNIKLAEKKGVSVRRGTIDDIAVFYRLYEETARRDAIAIHPEHYYRTLLELSAAQQAADPDSPLVTLYIAEHEQEPLAAIITLCTKTEAVYLYGASSNSKRNLMPAYLLQWTAICDAAEYGAKVYDFYGIPPTDDEQHPMHGLYRFKTGFGGREVHRIGSIDAPVSALYGVYAVLEKLRSFWFKTVKKRIAGR